MELERPFMTAARQERPRHIQRSVAAAARPVRMVRAALEALGIPTLVSPELGAAEARAAAQREVRRQPIPAVQEGQITQLRFRAVQEVQGLGRATAAAISMVPPGAAVAEIAILARIVAARAARARNGEPTAAAAALGVAAGAVSQAMEVAEVHADCMVAGAALVDSGLLRDRAALAARESL